MNNNKFLFTWLRTKDHMNRELYFSNYVHKRERNFVEHTFSNVKSNFINEVCVKSYINKNAFQ